VLGGLSESVFYQTLNEELSAIHIFVCVDVRQSTNVCHQRFIHFDVQLKRTLHTQGESRSGFESVMGAKLTSSKPNHGAKTLAEASSDRSSQSDVLAAYLQSLLKADRTLLLQSQV
jgi:hypothetical protein